MLSGGVESGRVCYQRGYPVTVVLLNGILCLELACYWLTQYLTVPCNLVVVSASPVVVTKASILILASKQCMLSGFVRCLCSSDGTTGLNI